MLANAAPIQDGHELRGCHSSCRSHVFSPALAEKGAESLPLLHKICWPELAELHMMPMLPVR